MGQGLVVMPGVFSALSALCAAKAGARAGYVSGAAVTNSFLAMPDIGLLTMDEMATQARKICQAAPIPFIADADTGYGEVWNVTRCVIEMERAGLAGIHLEDQLMPKKCGHLDGKALVSPQEMARKLLAAAEAKSQTDFLLIARTDARGVEGLEAAIDRAKMYCDFGADAVFPEGLQSEEEFEAFRTAVDVPLLANMTEFGKTPIIPARRFAELGYNMVIFPVSAMRVKLKAVTAFYSDLIQKGTQADWIDRMMTRAELYDLIDYPLFEETDQAWAAQAE
jgi:methylisocitrate lyase